MKFERFSCRTIAIVFWILAVGAMGIWLCVAQPGWDAQVYNRAIHAVAAGHDPWVEGVSLEEAFYRNGPQFAGDTIPYAYVYSPITLPLLRLAAKLPGWLLASEYWLLYVMGILAQIAVTFKAARTDERNWALLIAPAVIYFPGLLQTDVVQSGNVAYILYGLALAAAWHGWRKNSWWIFYLVVIVASCFKQPYLSWVALPLLSARKQWLPAVLTSVAGVALFAVQPVLWPEAFRNFLRAVEYQFSGNHDFGSSPAGQLGKLLLLCHVSRYEMLSWVFYFLYVIPVFAVLWLLAARYKAGQLSLQRWMPVLLVGVVLLNPRHIEYDVAPLTLPMALIVLRLARRLPTRNAQLAVGAALLVTIVAVILHMDAWRTVECFLLMGCFAGGGWDLLQPAATEADCGCAPA